MEPTKNGKAENENKRAIKGTSTIKDPIVTVSVTRKKKQNILVYHSVLLDKTVNKHTLLITLLSIAALINSHKLLLPFTTTNYNSCHYKLYQSRLYSAWLHVFARFSCKAKESTNLTSPRKTRGHTVQSVKPQSLLRLLNVRCDASKSKRKQKERKPVKHERISFSRSLLMKNWTLAISTS